MRSQDHSKIKPGKAIPRPTISPETSSLSAETSPKIVEHKSARNSTSTIESDDTDIDLSGISPDLRIKCPISHDVKTDVTTNTTFSSSMETRGYSELASLIASSPSQTSTIFRRFDKMNMRNLLILENEIADLERRLEHLEFSKTKTMESNVGVKIQSTGEKANKIKEIGLQLKEKVKEYYEGILLTKEMLALSRPNQKSLNATRRMVTNRRAGSPLDFIAGPMAQHLSPKYENDLSVLSPEMEDDFIKRFFNGKFINSIDGCSSSNRATYAVSFTSALFAAIFLIGAVVGLYFVSDIRSRLAMLSTFTLVFAAAIALLTNARRQDVFVATAAYAAVLVVFVSGNIAVDPIPIRCILQDESGGALSNAALNNAVPQNSVIPTATVTATMIQTVLTVPSSMIVFSTVVSNPSPTATVFVKKGEMSDLTKTGIGVGASVGLLFCLMVIVCGFLPWLRQKRWAEIWSCGGSRRERKKRDSRRRVEGSRGVWSFNEKNEVKEQVQETSATEMELKDGRVVWV